MKNQIYIVLNENKVIWDLDKNPILTVIESDSLQVFIPTNYGDDISFFIEDYELTLIKDNEYIYCEKVKVFLESFGTSIGRLYINNQFFEIAFEVLAKKIESKKIDSILNFLYINNKEILNISFSRTQRDKTIKETGVAEPEVLVKQAEIFVNKFMEFRQDFSSNLKKRLVPQQVPIWKSKDNKDFLEIEDFFENLDRLSPSLGDGDVVYNGRFFSIERTYKTELVETTSTYENSTILGGAQSVLDKIRHISEFLFENFTDGTSYDKEYESLGNCIARVSYSSLSLRCKSLINNLEEIIRYLRHDLHIPYKGQLLPQVTPYVRGIKVYRILFDQIAIWYKLGSPDFSGLNFLSKIRSLSKLYELFCLYKLYELFHNLGWVVINATKNETLGADIPSCVVFQRNEEHVEIHYEKIISGINDETKHLDLVDLYHKDKWIYNFYSPDYVIKHIKNDDVNYLILDAKYSTYHTVSNIHLPNIYEKYYNNMGVVDLKRNLISSQRIVAISVLYPNYSRIFSKHKENNNHISRNIVRLPLYTGVSVQDDLDTSLEKFIIKALNSSSRLMQPL